MLVSPGEEGNRVGMLELTIARTVAGRSRVSRFANSFRLFNYTAGPDDPLVRQRIHDYRETLRVRLESDEDIP
ncbi:MAG: hypothetical protein A2177_01780 [Spirochaetes bacterium RBG_13_68_11]|nr:MAG: hypothetical protein A2177_01780 [Spirochaetes bacterium RBG_13_68_11]